MGCECNIIKVQGNNCLVNPDTKNWKQLNLNEIIHLTPKYPDIKKINSVNLEVVVTDTNFIQTPDSLDVPNAEGTYLTGLKLIVSGEVLQTISYNGDDICKVYNFRTSIPFSTFIILDPGYNVKKPICIESCLLGALIQPLGPRTVQSNIDLFLWLM